MLTDYCQFTIRFFQGRYEVQLLDSWGGGKMVTKAMRRESILGVPRSRFIPPLLNLGKLIQETFLFG